MLENVEQALGDQLGTSVELGLFHEHRELVAPQAAHRVALAHRPAQSLAHDRQQLVPGGVPEGIVDPLEAVNVDVERGGRSLFSAGSGQHPLCSVVHEDAVGQTSEGVVQRQVTQLILGEQQIALREELAHGHQQGEQDRNESQAQIREDGVVAQREDQQPETDRDGEIGRPACVLTRRLRERLRRGCSRLLRAPGHREEGDRHHP